MWGICLLVRWGIRACLVAVMDLLTLLDGSQPFELEKLRKLGLYFTKFINLLNAFWWTKYNLG